MTLFEFRLWLDGFLSGLSEAPNAAQRAVISGKLQEIINAKPTER